MSHEENGPPSQPKSPPGKILKDHEVHPGRVPPGKAGKAAAHGKKVGHTQFGTVTFLDNDTLE
jgi:hypothetical protein